MKISYAITTHNETEEINELLGFLIHHMATSDEIVILDDFSKSSYITTESYRNEKELFNLEAINLNFW